MSEFSFDSINNFDNHINESINGYHLLHSLLINISDFFIKDNSTCLDIGCTSGMLIHKIKSKHVDCECIGIDIIDSNFIDGAATLMTGDVTKMHIPKANLILSVFTLQFIDINKRIDVIKRVHDSLSHGGAFLVCEKEISSNGFIQEVFTFTNYDYKKSSFTEKEILDKEKTLRKIMNPMDNATNMELLSVFRIVEPFFQSLNFKGYLCVK